MSWEKNTVERAIEIEERMEAIVEERERVELRKELAEALGLRNAVYDQWIEELESELSDLQREYRG